MDISLKYRMIEQIIQSRDDSILGKIKSLLDSQQDYDFWDDLPTGVKSAIVEAEKEIEEGKGIAHVKVMKEVKARIHP